MNRSLVFIAGSIALAFLVGWLAFGFFGIQALFYDTVVNEELPPMATSTPVGQVLPSSSSTVTTFVSKGAFTQGDSTYTIKGNASLVQKNDERMIVLSDFSVTNGPDLYVYLVTASNTQNLTVKEAVSKGAFVEVATLKGNQGNQVYTLPKNLDVPEDALVVIWCKRFSRNFGSAQLK